MYVNIRISKHLKEKLAWVIDKQLGVISNKNSFTTKKLKNKALKQYCIGCYVDMF